MMRLVSVNVGKPRQVLWQGKARQTGIFKTPVAGRVALRRHNLDGDEQANRKVHGGPTKAVYAYPAHHYQAWRGEMPGVDLPWGSFGENFDVEGCDEETVCIGDEFVVGEARLVVTEPRLPCSNLIVRFDQPDIVKRFLQSLRTGFYLGVVEEGGVAAGDEFRLASQHPDRLAVADVVRAHSTHRADRTLLEKASRVEALPPSWREEFSGALAKLRGRGDAT